MSAVKNSIYSSDLEKEEKFHMSEMEYHQEQMSHALKEFRYHLLKSNEHLMELESLKLKLSWEA